MLKKSLLTLSVLVSFISAVSAQTPNTQLFKTVKATAKEANESVFYVNAPASGTVTVGIEGNDRFSTSSENHANFSIRLEGKTAYISLPNTAGEYSAGIGTICGTSISVAIKVYEPGTTADSAVFLPKVIIDAPSVCQL